MGVLLALPQAPVPQSSALPPPLSPPRLPPRSAFARFALVGLFLGSLVWGGSSGCLCFAGGVCRRSGLGCRLAVSLRLSSLVLGSASVSLAPFRLFPSFGRLGPLGSGAGRGRFWCGFRGPHRAFFLPSPSLEARFKAARCRVWMCVPVAALHLGRRGPWQEGAVPKTHLMRQVRYCCDALTG